MFVLAPPSVRWRRRWCSHNPPTKVSWIESASVVLGPRSLSYGEREIVGVFDHQEALVGGSRVHGCWRQRTEAGAGTEVLMRMRIT
jgi:hypothetical protein